MNILEGRPKVMSAEHSRTHGDPGQPNCGHNSRLSQAQQTITKKDFISSQRSQKFAADLKLMKLIFAGDIQSAKVKLASHLACRIIYIVMYQV